MAYHTPTLPYSLLKLESLYCAQRIKPDCFDEDLRGFQSVDVSQWRNLVVLENQPGWRLKWFKKYPNSNNSYAQVSRNLQIDPIFCPYEEDPGPILKIYKSPGHSG